MSTVRTAIVPGSLYHIHRQHKKKVRRTRHKRFHKGSPSKTRKGRQDFVTHLGSNVFDRLGHWILGTRKPYTHRRRRRRRRRRTRHRRRK